MYYSALYNELPKIAEQETRSIIVVDQKQILPKGVYSFIETYCTDKTCDCRRAIIQVFAPESNFENSLAAISYGWEPLAFYGNWGRSLPKDMVDMLKGPALDLSQPQSEFSELLLELFKTTLQDKEYRNRIIRHYVMFKEKTGMKTHKDMAKWSVWNLACPCGSGKKFKFCCGSRRLG